MPSLKLASTIWHRFAQQSADADTPASGYWNKYFKAGGLYLKSAAGGVFSLGGADATELTIASGAITRSQLYHKVDTEANAGSDNLDTISGGVAGQELFIRADNTARTVVIRDLSTSGGNINTGGLHSIALDETYKIAHLIFDGTNWNVVGYHAYPNDVPAWGAFAPDASLNFIAEDTAGGLYRLNGEEMKLWSIFQFSADISFDAVGNMHALFDSATAFTMTINASTIIAGMEWKAQVLTAPGAGTHKLKLPGSCTFDGTNNTAEFNATSDYLRGSWISATRFLLDPTTASVTFSIT